MTDPERALQAAVLARLRSDEACQAVLRQRVWDQPPALEDEDGYDWPYLLFGRAETRPIGAEGGGYEHRLTLSVASRYGGSEEAKAAVGAVRACLDGAALALSGWRCVDLRVTYADVFRGSDLVTTYGTLRLRAVVEASE